MTNRLSVVVIIALCLLASIRAFSVAFADEENSGSFKREIYRVEVDKSVTGVPPVATVWRMFGEYKVKWRTEIFFEKHPDEKKYRYTFAEERDCRLYLADQWEKLNPDKRRYSDQYLENLVKVRNSRYFDEYIYANFRKGSWDVDKEDFYLDEYKKWRKRNMKGSRKETKVKLIRVELAEW